MMYTAEQLSAPTNLHRQTLFVNLKTLHNAAIFHISQGPGSEVSVQQTNTEDDDAYTLIFGNRLTNNFGQATNFYKEVRVTKDGQLDYYVESELGALATQADTHQSDDVDEYEEAMEKRVDRGIDPEEATVESYSLAMVDVVESFETITSAELASYVALTDDLIDRYAPSQKRS